MGIKPIRNDQDHDKALQEVQRLWGSRPGTPKGDMKPMSGPIIPSVHLIPSVPSASGWSKKRWVRAI